LPASTSHRSVVGTGIAFHISRTTKEDGHEENVSGERNPDLGGDNVSQGGMGDNPPGQQSEPGTGHPGLLERFPSG
jgi:hypothetical protein